jgi:hypothetical protein
MDAPDRRRLLAAIGSAGAASLLAGCGDAPLDGTPEPTSTVSPAPTATLESRFVDDGVVDYPGMVDGAATVEDADGGSRIEYDADAETLTVTHEEGETVSTSALLVVRGGVEERWPTPVAVGDRLTVTVSPDATVQVIWADGGRQQTIDKWTGPDG